MPSGEADVTVLSSDEKTRPPRAGAVLRCAEVGKDYGSHAALVDVTLDLAAGSFTSIMGPSGSGKSTLLHLLGALDTPSRGHVLFDGHDVMKLSEKARTEIRRL